MADHLGHHGAREVKFLLAAAGLVAQSMWAYRPGVLVRIITCGRPKPCRGWSCGSSVFVDEASAACRLDNSNLLMAVGVWRLCRRWRPLIKRPVGPVDVVVVDVVEHEPLKLALIPDDGAIKEFSAQGGDPPFRERVGHWDASRGAQDLETFGSEDLVEVAGELTGAVSQKCSSVAEPAGMGHEDGADPVWLTPGGHAA